MIRILLQKPGVSTRVGQKAYYRRARANRAAPLVFSLGAPVALAGAYVEYSCHLYSSALGNLLIVSGCVVSAMLARSKSPAAQNHAWIPGCLCLWLASFPILLQNGGIASPLCLGFMSLIFVAISLVQTRVSISTIVSFVSLNFLYWILRGDGHWSFAFSQLSSEAQKEMVLLMAVFSCVGAMLKVEEEIAQEADKKTEALVETQGQLVHSSKMAEFGDLLATTAHELSQPIQVITTASSLLERILRSSANLEKRTEATILLGRIEEASWRAKRLLTQIRDFSRNDQFEPTLMDLRESLKSVQGFFQYDLNTKHIPFQLVLPDTAIWVRADNLKIQQVLLNLINNARDATLQAQKPEVKVELERYRGWARISVTNTGPEIPIEVQKKLFQNYFTTKTLGRGTGLGLKICADLTDLHNGRILFTSDSEKTVFILDLPWQEPAEPSLSELLSTNSRAATLPVE